jgi:DNA replication protein DnaC
MRSEKSEPQALKTFDLIRQKAADFAARKAQENAQHDAYLERMARERAEAEVQARAEHEAKCASDALAHLVACGVGEKDAQRVLAGLDASWEAVKQARAFYTQKEKLLLLLYGQTGTGKTFAAIELITLLRFGFIHPEFGNTWVWPSAITRRGRYVTADYLAGRSAFGEDVRKENERLRAYRLLVIDECGREVMTPAWASCFEALVSDRHRAGLKTVLLSNCEAAVFKQQYGERIARRIREDGTAVNLGAKTLSIAPKLRTVKSVETK